MPTEAAPFWCWNKQCRLYKKCHAGECEVPETDRTPVAAIDWSAIKRDLSKSFAHVPFRAGFGIGSWLAGTVECSPDGGQTWIDCTTSNCINPTRVKPVQP